MSETHLRTFLEDLKARAAIEEIVRVRLGEQLERKGALWAACCPFHAEKTPSFKVDPQRQKWHCYGSCGEGGDVISFVERFDNVGFREAVESVAQFAGVTVPEALWGGRARGEDPRLERLREVLERASRLYQRQLFGSAGERARDYLRDRGLSRETCEAFDLGWALDDGSAVLEMARTEGWPFELIAEAGLARRNDSGREYDFFRGRLVIPIRDLRGRPVGFGARRLVESAGPKYVNTPETPLFHKSKLIYGLDRAMAEVRSGHHLVLVEGYTDVMAAHQVGLSNVVAVLGTATTDDHAALVRRSGARRVTLVFDGDAAGTAAALKALRGLLPLGLALDVAVLPSGADPCDLCIQGGAEGLRAAIESARDWFEFLLGELEGLGGGELAAAVDPILECTSRLANEVERDLRLSELAAHLGVPVGGLRQRLEKRKRRGGPAPRGPAAAPPARLPGVPDEAQPPASGAETPAAAQPDVPSPRLQREAFAEIAGACFLDNSLIPALQPWFGECPDPLLMTVLDAISDLYADEDDPSPVDTDRLLAHLADDPARRIISTLEERARLADSPTSLANGAVGYLRRCAEEQEWRTRSREVLEADDWGTQARVLRSLDEQLRNPKEPAATPEFG